MNTEYSLIKLLLKNPERISELTVKGFKSSYFKKKEYGKTYNLILDRWSRFHSTPTQEDLDSIKVKIGDEEEIPHTLEHCVEVIYQDFIKEVLAAGITEAANSLVDKGPDASMNILRQAINGIPRLDGEQRARDISETTDEFMADFHAQALHKGKIVGLETGFHDIDLHTKGLLNQWLVVIQGRNGQFKSWLLAHMIKTWWMQKKNILLYSCEMSVKEFEARIHSLVLNIPPRQLGPDAADISGVDYNTLQDHMQSVKEKAFGRLIINDNPGDIGQISMEIASYMEKFPIDVVCIDAAYGLNGPGDSTTERYNNIAKACKMDLAKKFNIPVVVSIQLNRDFDKDNPDGLKEIVADGRSAYGGDAWNQYADVMFVLRRTPKHAPFHYNDFKLSKFRHGEQGINYMLKINLKEPIITQVDYEMAKAQMSNEDPTAQKQTDSLFDQTNKIFKKLDISKPNDMIIETSEEEIEEGPPEENAE